MRGPRSQLGVALGRPGNLGCIPRRCTCLPLPESQGTRVHLSAAPPGTPHIPQVRSRASGAPELPRRGRGRALPSAPASWLRGGGTLWAAPKCGDPSSGLLTRESIQLSSGDPELRQMPEQMLHIFLLLLPSPESCWRPVHGKLVNWNCPCCPSEKWDVVHCVPWRKSPICSLREDNYVYKLCTSSSLPSPGVCVGGCPHDEGSRVTFEMGESHETGSCLGHLP